MNEILQMDWPAAVVFIAAIAGSVVVYGIRTAAREETKRIERQKVPGREVIEHD